MQKEGEQVGFLFACMHGCFARAVCVVLPCQNSEAENNAAHLVHCAARSPSQGHCSAFPLEHPGWEPAMCYTFACIFGKMCDPARAGPCHHHVWNPSNSTARPKFSSGAAASLPPTEPGSSCISCSPAESSCSVSCHIEALYVRRWRQHGTGLREEQKVFIKTLQQWLSQVLVLCVPHPHVRRRLCAQNRVYHNNHLLGFALAQQGTPLTTAWTCAWPSTCKTTRSQTASSPSATVHGASRTKQCPTSLCVDSTFQIWLTLSRTLLLLT